MTGGAFHDPAAFAFTRTLEASWADIHREFLGVAADIAPWPEEKLHAGGWEVFGLFGFPHGEAIAGNVRRCPRTAALIENAFPRHRAAGFSVLAPGTRIAPHEGYQGQTLRCHLGLEVPAGDCALEVAGERRRWEAGRVLVFDDRQSHAAWNLTASRRVLLLVDFVSENTL